MTAFRAQAELAGELAERFFRRIGDDAVPLADAMDDLDGAIEALDHAFDLAPRNEREEIAGELGYLRLARFELGSQERDDLDTAIRLLRHAAEADPDLATAAELGRALDYRYGLDEADADRDEAIRILRPVCDAGEHDPVPDPELLVTLAVLLACRGEQHSDMTDMTDAIGYAERSLPWLPGDSADRASALYVLGIGHLLRGEQDPASAPADQCAAVVRLRQLRATLAADEPWYAEVTAWYGMALATRVATLAVSFRVSNALRKRADEAIRILAECEPGLPRDDPRRLHVRFAAAQTRAIRHLMLDGPADDRHLALAELAEISDLPGCGAAMAGLGHYLCAMLLVTSPVDDDLRRVATRYDSVAHRRFLRALGTRSGPAHENARQALDHLNHLNHLNRLPEPGAACPVTAAEILDLRAFAVLHQREGGPAEEDLRLATALVEQAIGLTQDDDPDLGMRHAMIGFVRGELAKRQSHPDDYGELVQSLITAAEKLPQGYQMQPVLLGMLGEFAGRHGPGRHPSHEAGIAAAELVERALRHVPADHPARATVLTRLGEILLAHTVFDHSAGHLDRIRGLLKEAMSQPAVDEANKAVNHYLLGLADGVAALFGGDFQRFDAAAEQLRHAAELAPPGHRLRVSIPVALAAMLRIRSVRYGNLELLDAADHYAAAALTALREAGAGAGADADDMTIVLEQQLALAPVMRQASRLGRPDAHAVDTAARQLEELAGRFPADHHLRHSVESDRQLLRMLSMAPLGAGPSPARSILPSFAAAFESLAAGMSRRTRPHDQAAPLALAMAGQAKAASGLARHNRRLVNEGLAMLFQAWDATISIPPDHAFWGNAPTVLHLLSKGLRVKYYLTGDRADLSHAIARLEDAHREIRQRPMGTLPAVISYELAEAYWARGDSNLGDRRRAAESGQRVLRDYAKDVLLQSSADRAFAAALSAADKASVIARWCLAAGLPEAAVEALELGRGMVLHTAVTETTVPALLREAGHPDLAAEWEASGGTGPAPWDGATGPAELAGLLAGLPQAPLPSDLRQRVIAVIEDTETERNLLAPPGVAEIAAALRAANVDALAYLLPGQEDEDYPEGLAVLVGADERVRDITLPRLEAGPRSRVDTFAAAQREWLQAERARDEEAAIPARRRWRGALADVCDWAWTAAMDEVLSAVPAVPGRPARLVLVPVGKLGLVPWHAARRTVPHGGRRYACQDAIISYAASARQYVTARRLAPRPWRTEPALIAVSEYWTDRAIGEIRRRCYPRGRLLAGPEANAQNVRGLLPGPGSPGASLLHAGTHAEPAEHPLGSRLRLQGGESLSLTDLLRQARDRPADVAGGLIVLAACGTDLTGRAHDEALTLATAFLALGAVGAVGTRWPVRDVPTAVFMTVFHQHLNSGYEEPAAALRATQLWMLDPHRDVAGRIDPALAGEMRTIDPDALEAWAVYTYQGR